MAEAIVCDFCGKVQVEKPSLIEVERKTRVVLRMFRNPCYFGDYKEIKHLDLCDDCVQKLLDNAKEGA